MRALRRGDRVKQINHHKPYYGCVGTVGDFNTHTECYKVDFGNKRICSSYRRNDLRYVVASG